MKILLSGYFGFGNLGDELILKKIIRLFSNTDHHVTVLDRVDHATSDELNIRHVPRASLVSLYREVKKCDVLVSGGGGLIQDLSGPFSPLYYLGIIALAQMMGKRTVLLAQGFGPVRRWWNKVAIKKILPRADWVVPRDPAGMDWCRNQGVRPDRLVLGADLVWLMPRLESNRARQWVVCLRADWLAGRIPEWLHQLKRIAAQQGKTLHFISVGNRGDHALLERIQREPAFWDCRFTPMTEAYQIEVEPVRFFQDAQLVLSMRYHGLILGALAGAVVVGFGKDDKLSNLIQDLEQPISDVTGIDFNTLLAKLPGLSRTMRMRVEALRQRARTAVQEVFDRYGM